MKKLSAIDWILAGLFLCVTFILAGCGYLSPAVVTKAEFDSLATGDSLAAVQAKIGDAGALASKAGEIQMWQWQNRDGSNAIVTFGAKGLEGKAQAGLK